MGLYTQPIHTNNQIKMKEPEENKEPDFTPCDECISPDACEAFGCWVKCQPEILAERELPDDLK